MYNIKKGLISSKLRVFDSANITCKYITSSYSRVHILGFKTFDDLHVKCRKCCTLRHGVIS